MLDTLESALRYKSAGFTDAQVEALVEGDRMVKAVRVAAGRPGASPLADRWRLWFAVGAIGAVGSCDLILYLAIRRALLHSVPV